MAEQQTSQYSLVHLNKYQERSAYQPIFSRHGGLEYETLV